MQTLYPSLQCSNEESGAGIWRVCVCVYLLWGWDSSVPPAVRHYHWLSSVVLSSQSAHPSCEGRMSKGTRSVVGNEVMRMKLCMLSSMQMNCVVNEGHPAGPWNLSLSLLTAYYPPIKGKMELLLQWIGFSALSVCFLWQGGGILWRLEMS